MKAGLFHQTERLANGLRLVWLDLPYTHSVALVGGVAAGPRYETDQNAGVTHLLEHLRCTGTQRLPNIADFIAELQDNPGDFEASTAYDRVDFTFDTAPERLARVGALLADILAVKPLDPQRIEAEKRVIRSETLSCAPSFADYLHGRLFRGHALARSTVGTAATMRNLTPEQIAAYDRAAFDPSRIVCVVAGRIVAEQFREVRARLADLPAQPGATLTPAPPPTPKLPHFKSLFSVGAMRNVCLGFCWIGRPEPRVRLALRLLHYGLAGFHSDLFERLRYRAGSTYVFDAQYYWVGEAQLFGLAGLPQRRERDAFLQAMLAELARIRDGAIAPEWFERVRRKYLFRIEEALDSPLSVCHRLAGEELDANRGPVLSIPEEIDLLRDLRFEEVSAAIRQYLTRERMFLFYQANTRLFDDSRLRKLVAKSW